MPRLIRLSPRTMTDFVAMSESLATHLSWGFPHVKATGSTMRETRCVLEMMQIIICLEYLGIEAG